ncbi:MAG: cupin domain-containing protein [Planctomycetota bacterium]|jgi:quercetin dioxygenase-like cupin family protein
MEQYKVPFELMPWENPMVGVRFKVYEQDGKKLRLAELAKGFVEQDWCRKGHIGYVLEGQMEVDFDGKVIVFGTGDGIFIPAGEEHKHKGTALTEAVKVVLVEDV